MKTCSGETKSLTSELNESDERLLTKAEPSVPHWRSPRFGKSAAIEIDASPNVTVRFGTEVVDAGSGGQLEHLVLRDRTDGTTTVVPADALFIFIGARPHTDWLAGALALDKNGFVLTGHDLIQADPPCWLLERAPAWLETSMPNVFAAGDIRSGSVKRVAAAVGEGATAATFVREHLAQHNL